MPRKRKKDYDEGEPEPLNFEDEEHGLRDHLREIPMNAGDARGDSEDDQYYEEEEAISPEEVEDREEEDTL